VLFLLFSISKCVDAQLRVRFAGARGCLQSTVAALNIYCLVSLSLRFWRVQSMGRMN
jgi:hypothetical protein